MEYEDIISYDNFGSLLMVLRLENVEQLAYLIKYTSQKNPRIYYYDILAAHKDSAYKYTDFLDMQLAFKGGKD